MHSAVPASRRDAASRLILTPPLRAHPPQPPTPNLYLFVSLILPPKLFQTPNRDTPTTLSTAFASVQLPPSGDNSGEIPAMRLAASAAIERWQRGAG